MQCCAESCEREGVQVMSHAAVNVFTMRALHTCAHVRRSTPDHEVHLNDPIAMAKLQEAARTGR